jgi:dihydroxyacetone kinase-like protein
MPLLAQMTARITPESLRSGFSAIAERLLETAEELNALDATLGDGDLGTSLASIARAVREHAPSLPEDVGEALARIAKIIAGTSGSSFSGVMMVGLLAAANHTRGRSSVPVSELPGLLRVSIDAISERAGARLGDKSVLDGIAAIADAVEQASSGIDVVSQAEKALQEALVIFRDRPCQIGRGRLAGKRSVGCDDPGMVALQRMLEGAIRTRLS